MDDAAKVALQRVFRVLTEIGHPATNGVVFSIVRGAKLRFRNNEGKTLLASMRADPGPVGVQFGRTQGPPGVQAGPPSRKRTRSKELSKTLPIVQDRLSLLTTFGEHAPSQGSTEKSPNGVSHGAQDAGTEPGTAATRSAQDASQLAAGTSRSPWARATEARVMTMKTSRIDALDHRQMFDVAALHILRFMAKGVRTDEKARKLAVHLAGRIRKVATAKDHPQMTGLTVEEYFGYGREIWDAAEGADWDFPWAVVTWAEAPEKAPS